MRPLTHRQSQILEFIDRYRDAAGFPPSVREIGAEFGLSPATVHDHLKALEKKGSLERQPGRSRSLSTAGSMHARPVPSRRGVPLLGRVAAGAPILAEEHVEDVLDLPPQWIPDDAFLLRVEGDSMRDAHILNGDLVLVRSRKTASNGEIVVALVEDDATVKRFRKTPAGVELLPENPDYSPIRITESDGTRVEILGVVVGVFRPPAAGRMSRRNS